MQSEPDLTTAADFDCLPLTQTCRRIDFDYVAIEAAAPRHGPLLVVAGTKDWLNLAVELRPRCYQTRPAYWAFDVVATLPGYGIEGAADYNVVLPLDGLCGTDGVEVVGATRSERRLFSPPRRSGTSDADS